MGGWGGRGALRGGELNSKDLSISTRRGLGSLQGLAAPERPRRWQGNSPSFLGQRHVMYRPEPSTLQPGSGSPSGMRQGCPPHASLQGGAESIFGRLEGLLPSRVIWTDHTQWGPDGGQAPEGRARRRERKLWPQRQARSHAHRTRLQPCRAVAPSSQVPTPPGHMGQEAAAECLPQLPFQPAGTW